MEKLPSLAADVLAAHSSYSGWGQTYVLESTISRNSWFVGTTGMSFHCVFMLAVVATGDCVGGVVCKSSEAIDR